MVRFAQFVLSLLPLASWRETQESSHHDDLTIAESYTLTIESIYTNASKSIAIVGAGSAGLAILKTLLDLRQEDWDVVLYEQRRDVGGVWLPDPNEPQPPTLPETPLYPRLRTNTPHPTMTYPGYTFRPGTPLFPSHQYVEQYHTDFVLRNNLSSYIHVNHTVHAAGWKGNNTTGKWELEVHRTTGGSRTLVKRAFDHLIVANGHNHYPRIPEFHGSDEWLSNTRLGGGKREIFHSIFYRHPELYADRTVLVVGGGASGRDAVLQVSPVAVKVSISSRLRFAVSPDSNPALPRRIIHLRQIKSLLLVLM